jgi:hypothetical protein
METNTHTPFPVMTTLAERASAAVRKSQSQLQTSLNLSATSFNPSSDWPESLK